MLPLWFEIIWKFEKEILRSGVRTHPSYNLAGGWATHPKHMLVTWDHFPKVLGKNNKSLKPTPSYEVPLPEMKPASLPLKIDGWFSEYFFLGDAAIVSGCELFF